MIDQKDGEHIDQKNENHREVKGKMAGRRRTAGDQLQHIKRVQQIVPYDQDRKDGDKGPNLFLDQFVQGFQKMPNDDEGKGKAEQDFDNHRKDAHRSGGNKVIIIHEKAIACQVGEQAAAAQGESDDPHASAPRLGQLAFFSDIGGPEISLSNEGEAVQNPQDRLGGVDAGFQK